MTIAVDINRTDYVGNGAVSEYDFTTVIRAEADLKVYVQEEDGTETLLTLTDHYTVDGVGSANGGSITLVADAGDWMDGDFLADDVKLVIRGDRAAKQTSSIRNQNSFYPETHEDALDNLALTAAAHEGKINRSIKAAETDDPDLDMTLPVASARASRYAAYDEDGQPIALDVLTDTVSLQEFSSYGLTASWTANTTLTAKARLLAGRLRVQAKLALTGAPTSAALTVSLASGDTVDTASMINSDRQVVGRNCHVVAAGGTPEPVMVVLEAGSLKVLRETWAAVTQAVPATFASGDEVVLDFEVPIE